jgi:uncharacterized metal-binding protein YceD (DUF177 family)
MLTAPEFSRTYRIDQLGAVPLTVEIEASAHERLALAARFGLLEIGALSARAQLSIGDARPLATGTIIAQVTQACVASGKPVAATLDLPFRLLFVDESTALEAAEIEIRPDDLDEMPFANGMLDLGEAVAQSMALSLDPFPRSREAAQVLRAAGVVPEGEEPRGAFAGLRDILAR